MIVGVVRETYPGERRVAITPGVIPALGKAGIELIFERGAGESAAFPDEAYSEKGAKVVADRGEVFRTAQVVCQVRTSSANPTNGGADLPLMHADLTTVGLAEPFGDAQVIADVAATGARCFALELLPRITRAQSMDVLSSQATVAGNKAVLLAAAALPRIFPMMMTAAGTIAPARVFVIGAGVAGLQAIATARRLGAVVQAYDVRPAVKEQVESIGARFVQIAIEGGKAEGTGGYAKSMDEDFYRRQRELMAGVVADSDVVIATAAVPGGKPPVLITADMVNAMTAGSVIVDLAAKIGLGGNCELTQPDQTIDHNGVTILGPTNLAATVPQSASQMYAKNMTAFVLNLVKDKQLAINKDDEIVRETLVCEGGQVVNPRLKPQSTGTAATV